MLHQPLGIGALLQTTNVLQLKIRVNVEVVGLFQQLQQTSLHTLFRKA
jgi:hypothetical protein